jgi:hypothetical protein
MPGLHREGSGWALLEGLLDELLSRLLSELLWEVVEAGDGSVSFAWTKADPVQAIRRHKKLPKAALVVLLVQKWVTITPGWYTEQHGTAICILQIPVI